MGNLKKTCLLALGLVVALAGLELTGKLARAASVTVTPPIVVGTDTTPATVSQSAAWVGSSDLQVGVSTPVETAVSLASGAGILVDVACSSGTYGSMMNLFDSTVTTQGIGGGPTFDSDKIKIGPTVISQGLVDTAKTSFPPGSPLGSWNPVVGRKFKNGLVGIKRNGNSPTSTGDVGKVPACSLGILQ